MFDVKSIYSNKDDEKEIVKAVGEARYFDKDARRLYFSGEDDDGNKIARIIKLNKRAKGYRAGQDEPIDESEWPAGDDIYKMRVIMETWNWNGNDCKRILMFELDEYLGKNDKYVTPGMNPFPTVFGA